MEKFENSVVQVSNFLAQQHPELIPNLINQHKRNLSAKVCSHFNDTIAYGPFKGMKFGADCWWNGSDRAAMILGFYEQEILNKLKEIDGRFTTLVDVGAADGYYGVGALVNRLFNKSYCFEISEKGREILTKNAVLNGVLDRMVIRGEAGKRFWSELNPNELIEGVALIVDIEGAEFDIFDQHTFDAMRSSIIFMEIHDSGPDAQQKVAKLKNDASRTHNIEELVTTSRDPSQAKEIWSLSDTDRWLLCSEDRPRMMSWFCFTPSTAECRAVTDKSRNLQNS